MLINAPSLGPVGINFRRMKNIVLLNGKKNVRNTVIHYKVLKFLFSLEAEVKLKKKEIYR